MTKTIYVKNEQLWDRARDKAETEGVSLSSVIERSLQQYVMGRDDRAKFRSICNAIILLREAGGFPIETAVDLILNARSDRGLDE